MPESLQSCINTPNLFFLKPNMLMVDVEKLVSPESGTTILNSFVIKKLLDIMFGFEI